LARKPSSSTSKLLPRNSTIAILPSFEIICAAALDPNLINGSYYKAKSLSSEQKPSSLKKNSRLLIYHFNILHNITWFASRAF
jgi:hypothetical protein